MNKLKSFLEDSLKINIKKLVPLSGGASAEINKIILDSGIEYILRRSAFKSNSPLAISKSVESNIQREVLKLGAPVPKIIFDFCFLMK